jgi:hypothetical protein
MILKTSSIKITIKPRSQFVLPKKGNKDGNRARKRSEQNDRY